MYSKINYSPYYYLNSRHSNLLDFGLKIGGKTRKEKLFKLVKIKIDYCTTSTEQFKYFK